MYLNTKYELAALDCWNWQGKLSLCLSSRILSISKFEILGILQFENRMNSNTTFCKWLFNFLYFNLNNVNKYFTPRVLLIQVSDTDLDLYTVTLILWVEELEVRSLGLFLSFSFQCSRTMNSCWEHLQRKATRLIIWISLFNLMRKKLKSCKFSLPKIPST